MSTIVDTPGLSTSNSYCDVAYADDYFDTRVALGTPWEDWDESEKTRFLIMASRTLDASMRGQKVLVTAEGGLDKGYYLVRRMWSGRPADGVQRLAWPRSGMYDQNGNAISTTVIPTDLKDAVCELAGQLALTDRTLDNDVSVQGISSVSAGSVSVSFRGGAINAQVLPDAVTNLLVPSWYTEEQVEQTNTFEFDTVNTNEE